MHRLDGGDRRHCGACAPGQEFIGGSVVGSPRMLAAKNSRKRVEARSPSAATSCGTTGEPIGTCEFTISPLAVAAHRDHPLP